MIRAVLKDLKYDDIGWCQCHEHIYIEDEGIRPHNPSLIINDYDKSLNELLEYKKAGGRSVVDAQPYGFGRSAEALIGLSRQSGINIVAVSGFHKLEYAKDSEYFHNISEDEITQIYIDEITKGMYSGGIQLPQKAGVLKCAKTAVANKTYDKLFSAVANAAAFTGVSVMMHVDKEADALGAVDFFAKNSVKPDRLIVCHLDRAWYDLGYHLEVAQAGALLEYDTINRAKYHSNEYEIGLISYMIEKGYLKNLLLSLDTTRERLKSYGADFGLDYILSYFKFRLMVNGIGENTINSIMTENAYAALRFQDRRSTCT